nr:MAG: hypothetical protein [Microvirus sp.]
MTPFRTWLNACEEAVEGEVNDQPSMTQPNEAMSVRDIIARFAQGVPLSQHDYGDLGLSEDEDYSDFDKMDYFEKMEYIEDNKQYIEELQARVDAENSVAKDQPSADPEPAEPPKEA